MILRYRYFSYFTCLAITLLLKTTLLSQELDKANENTSLTSLLQDGKDAERKNNNERALVYYHTVLIKNPSNKEAIQGIARITNLKKKQLQEVYQETREALLEKTEETWSNSKENKSDTSFKKNNRNENKNNTAMRAKLLSLIIPTVELEDTTISEAIDYLRQKSSSVDPDKKGINIVLNLPSSLEKEGSSTIAESFSKSPISLQLHNVPILVALEYVAKQADLKVHVDPYSVVLSLPSEDKHDLFTKEYFLAPHSLPLKEDMMSSDDRKTEDTNTSKYFSAKKYFESEGVAFPEGSSAHYIASSNKLVIHNTEENIELIDTLVTSVQNSEPAQVSIETKFIEVSQDQLDQLGINWLLDALELGNSGIYMSGRKSTGAYPSSSARLNTIENMQSGSTIQEDSIDSVIDHGFNEADTSHPSPGVFKVAGVYSDAQFQAVLHALSQKKGIDVMAAPHVTTKSGMKATVKIIEEFIYPTQYAPPQIPQSTTNSGNNIIHQAPPTIAPAFPNAWATKNLGVILEAKPTIGPDGCAIELELHPQITDFDGFINYGSPINTIGYHFSATNVGIAPFSSTLTTNTINQPVFTIREVNTSVTVWNGQTVVLGGLIREDTQKAEDKIPLLGDIPLAGRLFRSKADRKLKKNLIIFVTPKILTPNIS